MLDSDRTAILAILSRWQRQWLLSQQLVAKKAEIDAQLANAAGSMMNAEAGLRVFGYDVTKEGVWQNLNSEFYNDLVTFMAEEDTKNQQHLDLALRDFKDLLANEVITNEAAKKPPMPSIREIVVMRLRTAGETGERAKSIREYINSTYGVETHEKTVGMTLYRLLKEGLVRRDGHVWFFVPQTAETKNPGVSAPRFLD